MHDRHRRPSLPALVAFLAAGLLASTAGAATVRVPDGTTDPQAFHDVLESAAYGDTVLVPPGEYLQIVLPTGLVVRSTDGPQVTVVGSIVANEVDSTTVVEGFRVVGRGRPTGVVWAKESYVTIRDCDIEKGWAGVHVEFGDVRVENCRIRDCDNGLWFFESQGLVTGCTITECLNAINLKNGSPRIIRSEIARNSVGVRATEHSAPVVGGSLATANRFHDNRFHVRNESYQKVAGYRTWDEQVLQVPGNWWGSDCPDSTSFLGDVVFAPWVDEAMTRTLESCPATAVEASR